MDFLLSIEWLAVVKIIGVDLLLGMDNAIVISLACASLVPEVRNKAIVLGTLGAVGMRAILLAFAGWLVGFEYVRLIAGAYLIYIGYSLLVSAEDENPDIKKSSSIWGAMFTIMMADMMMSLDNVMAIVAASQSAGEHATLYAIAGVAFSIPIIVFGAKLITILMDKFPIVIWLGGGLLGLVGAEMLISDPVLSNISMNHTAIKTLGFTMVISAALLTVKVKK